MKTYTTEEFLDAVLSCKDRATASILSDRFAPKDSSTYESSYTPAVEPSWELFYALICMEEKFGLYHSASTFAVMDLLKPRISLVWSKKEKLPTADIEDFLQNLFLFISTTGIDKWDSKINDNFYAFINPELQTVVNETVVPEINKYLKQTRGITSVSSDELNEKLEGGFDAVDENTSVEDQALRNVERKNLSVLGKAITIEDTPDEKTGKITISTKSKKQIKNAIIAEGLFEGVTSMSDDTRDVFEELLGMNV